MALTTQTQAQLVATQVAAVQAGASGLQDFSDGAVLLALAQSNGEVALWLQALVLQYALLTRAATSQGADLDSWMADFAVTRLQAVAARGSETFSRVSTGLQVVVPVGATIETSDGTQSFTVVADTSNSAYSSGLGGYPIGPSATSVTATVQAVNAGSAANVTAGAVNVISGAIPGVDTCTNASPFTNGSDAETDAALRLRFVAYLNSLSQGTAAAVEYAVSSVQQGLDYELVENQSYAGGFQAGYFYVVVDDGSGSPSSTLLNNVRAAINSARPLTSQFSVFGPILEEITVTMTVIGSGGDPAAAAAAVSAYISTAGLGGTVEYTKLIQVAYNASPTITNIEAVLLNGGVADVVCSVQARPYVQSVTASA
jgi:phage-related baseplate assembly protein